jgi:hypothetical protein
MFYADNGEAFNLKNGKERPCVRCGKHPTVEGYDACIGHLSGVRSACCGHGVSKGYIIYQDGHVENEESLTQR